MPKAPKEPKKLMFKRTKRTVEDSILKSPKPIVSHIAPNNEKDNNLVPSKIPAAKTGKLKFEYKLAILALIISNLIWGAAPPIFKFALTNIPPFSLAFLRFLIATILLLPFLYRTKDWEIERKDWALIFQNTFYGITANISFFFLGLKLAPSINASIIATATSIFTTILAVIFIKEHPSKKVVLGNLIGFIGVLVIVASPVLSHSLLNTKLALVGNLLLVLATLSAAAQTITSRQLGLKYSAKTFTFYSFLLGTLSFLPFALYEFYKDPIWPALLNQHGILGIVFGGVFSSFIAYTIWGFAAEKITASEVGLYMYINPIVTVLIAIPLLGERITTTYVIGSILAIVGIYIAERRIPYLPFNHRK